MDEVQSWPAPLLLVLDRAALLLRIGASPPPWPAPLLLDGAYRRAGAVRIEDRPTPWRAAAARRPRSAPGARLRAVATSADEASS